MTAYTVALVSPEGDVEAWMTHDQLVTNWRCMAGQFATRADAEKVAAAHNRRDQSIRDGRIWRAVLAADKRENLTIGAGR